jgi:transmembrane sensor
METSNTDVRSEIALQAGDWFVRQRGTALTAEENASFLAWLQSSPLHVAEYMGVARVSGGLRDALCGSNESLDEFLATVGGGFRNVLVSEPTPSMLARQRRRVRARNWKLAACAVLATVAAVWWRHDGELLGIPKTYATARGEQQVMQLPDGSVLRLDTDSAVTVWYTGGERLVRLRHGQALVEVAHGDAARWFRFAAGDSGAIALGTRFNVRLQGRTSEFVVADGRIAVYAGNPPAPSGGRARLELLGRTVSAGYRMRVDSGVLAEQPEPVELGEALGWLQHRIVFQHRPLGAVAAEFNRYVRIPVVVTSEQLAAVPISGSFDADDVESFLAYLQRLPGVRIERMPMQIRVVSIPPAN